MRPHSTPSADRAPWRWATAGALVGLLLATALFAPARWLAAAVQHGSGGQVQLAQPRGSLWQGSAQLVFSGGTGSQAATALPGRIQWHLRPAWLGVQAQLSADCCTPAPLQFKVATAGWGGITLTLQDSQSSWPAALLAGLGTPWNTVQPQGQLATTTQNLGAHWSPRGPLRLTGRVQLDALAMSSRLSTLAPMGSYRVTLSGGKAEENKNDTPVMLQLSTLEGSLQLSGQGQWVGPHLRFTGVASATPERVEALSNLLNIIGRRDGARALINLG